MANDQTVETVERKPELRPKVILVEIRDSYGDVESAGTVLTVSEAARWYSDHGVNFGLANMPTPTSYGFSYTRKPDTES